ncbi:MAG: calcium/sodium antiporter [Spirochaetaceae bacterium]|nr:calcium/sodium antiporter [Spirochaetaceae bacterium]
MYIVLQILLLALGFVFLVKGSDWFVDGAAGIANRFGIPQLIIGLTIVAMGTSAPEAAVSITAAFNGSADITIGNIVGSNIMNVLVILGLSALVYPLTVAKSTLKIDIPLTIGITILLFVLGLNGTITRIDGIIMLVIFVAYILFLFWSAKNGSENPMSDELEEVNMDITLGKAILFTLVGLVLVIAGSNFVVKSATNIARLLGWSERFIGLTIVALGTSLPELFTSVSAAMKKNCDIAIGNIIGSNIFNILFVVGLSSLVIPVPFAPAFRFDTIVAGASVVLLLLFCLPKNKLPRWAGAVMLACYLAYFLWIL